MDISSKFSLYDTVAMIIPGGIVIMVAIVLMDSLFSPTIWVCLGYYDNIRCDSDIIYCTILLSFAYIIGIVNNYFSDRIFSRFRNNKKMIRYQLRKVVKENSIIYLNNYVNTKYICEPNSLRCKDVFWWIIRKESDKNLKCYYQAYYALAQKNLLGSIPIIESQVALLRNMILPFGLLGISYTIKCFCCCIFIDVFILLTIFLVIIPIILIVMVKRQNIIYSLVWESVNYYKI